MAKHMHRSLWNSAHRSSENGVVVPLLSAIVDPKPVPRFHPQLVILYPSKLLLRLTKTQCNSARAAD